MKQADCSPFEYLALLDFCRFLPEIPGQRNSNKTITVFPATLSPIVFIIPFFHLSIVKVLRFLMLLHVSPFDEQQGAVSHRLQFDSLLMFLSSFFPFPGFDLSLQERMSNPTEHTERLCKMSTGQVFERWNETRTRCCGRV